jgi:hypothetical protein
MARVQMTAPRTHEWREEPDILKVAARGRAVSYDFGKGLLFNSAN